MMAAVLQLANQSQGVAVWGILLITLVGYMQVVNRVKIMHVFVSLKFKYIEEKVDNLKKELDDGRINS
jgi:hypothetical protein